MQSHLSIKAQAMLAMMAEGEHNLINDYLEKQFQESTECLRNDCQQLRTKGKKFCSAECSKIYADIQREKYHANKELKKKIKKRKKEFRNDLIAVVQYENDIMIKPLTKISL